MALCGLKPIRGPDETLLLDIGFLKRFGRHVRSSGPCDSILDAPPPLVNDPKQI